MKTGFSVRSLPDSVFEVERIIHLSTSALRKLQDYPWHGNARELENAIERSVRLSKKDVLDAGDILIDDVPDCRLPAAMPEPQPGFFIEEYLSTSRKALINKAMELAGGNRSKAARLLGISPQAVHKFLKTVQNDEAGN